MQNFWGKLKKPIFALAPMEDVTDCAFREIFARYGKPALASPRRDGPDVMFTEFVNVDGLCHEEGRKKFEIDLKYTENQRPIVAQLWGRDPEKFRQAAEIIAGMKFDGIDINMGCPKDREVKLKTCAALIKEPQLAQYIIKRTREGAGGLPVSVKTRIGYNGNEISEWLPKLLEVQPAVVSIHARSKKDKSKVPARWEIIKEAVQIRNQLQSKTLIIGNGDIKSRQEGLQRIEQTGCDGVIIGRGAFGNPWIFRKDNCQPSSKQKLQAMLEHAKLFNQVFGTAKPFVEMRKFFKAYASGFEGAHELRAKLMQAEDYPETEKLVKNFLRHHNLE